MDILLPKFIQYQLYLLQLENYELGRYWKLLWTKGFWPKKNQVQRKELVWTAKAKALMLMAVALHIFAVILAGFIALRLSSGLDNFFTAVVLTAVVFLPFYFILFGLALLILKPLDGLAKHQLVRKARAKIERLEQPINRHATGEQADAKGLKVIGVAGSYGKTTMKEVLRQILDIRYKILATPESVNTPVGIARWILNNVTDETQIIIVEMGEHYKGDIKGLCDIASPDIAVVTGINESHLERMKDMDTVVSTVFEIVGNAKPGAMVVLNADDNRVMENYKKFVWPDNQVIEFRVSSFESGQFNAEKLCWGVEVEGIGKTEINLLGEYALADVDAAVKIGKSLGMINEELKKGIERIKPVEHRLQPIPSAADVLVIDDSYNGNPAGVEEAIKVLSRFTNRRKLVITPGLVEMGKSSAEIHRAIGKQLVGVADVVILVKNSVTGFIEEGIRTTPSAHSAILRTALSEVEQAAGAATPPRQGGEAPQNIPSTDKVRSSPPFQGGAPPLGGEVVGVKKSQIIWFNSALEAHAGLKNILKPGDVILFQNDWGDQYI